MCDVGSKRCVVAISSSDGDLDQKIVALVTVRGASALEAREYRERSFDDDIRFVVT